MREFFSTLFRIGKSFVALINEDQHLQLVLKSTRRGSIARLDITTPSIVEVRMVFHSKAVVEKAIQAKTLKSSRSYSTGKLLGNTMKKISKT